MIISFLYFSLFYMQDGLDYMLFLPKMACWL